MSFQLWLAIYMAVGLALGEGGIRAAARRNKRLGLMAYFLMVVLWPALLLAMIFKALRKG